MNAIEKFSLGPSVKLTRILDKAVIFQSNRYFSCIRKMMRGLEEHLADGEENHDFINGTYVYKIEESDGGVIYVRFEPGTAIIGSKILI